MPPDETNIVPFRGTTAERQKAAARVLANCSSVADAARQLDVSEATLRRWMVQEDFANLILRAREHFLRTEGATLGVRVMMELAEGRPYTDEKGDTQFRIAAPVRFQAAKELLAFGGHSQAGAAAEVAGARRQENLHEMSADQLERQIAAAQAALEEARRQVAVLEGVAEEATPEKQTQPSAVELW
ncbi:transposase [Roseomonas sp. BN140053]|uniref:transposase n=1 Tax=Roseomonas sp. BN140053 TaxID=3391898 RepID=UPI0039EA08FE